MHSTAVGDDRTGGASSHAAAAGECLFHASQVTGHQNHQCGFGLGSLGEIGQAEVAAGASGELAAAAGNRGSVGEVTAVRTVAFQREFTVYQTVAVLEGFCVSGGFKGIAGGCKHTSGFGGVEAQCGGATVVLLDQTSNGLLRCG